MYHIEFNKEEHGHTGISIPRPATSVATRQLNLFALNPSKLTWKHDTEQKWLHQIQINCPSQNFAFRYLVFVFNSFVHQRHESLTDLLWIVMRVPLSTLPAQNRNFNSAITSSYYKSPARDDYQISFITYVVVEVWAFKISLPLTNIRDVYLTLLLSLATM